MLRILPMTSAYEGYLRDESRSVGKAESISFPESEKEVRAVLKSLAQDRIPVTIQGGRTGLAAAAVPSEGHVMNLSRMNRISGMRREGDRYLLRVEPGLPLAALRKAVEDRNMDVSGWTEEEQRAFADFSNEKEFFFPTDPTETSATLGGMAACNASGARTYRYGSARDHITGLRVVLWDGSLLVLQRGVFRADGRRLTLVTEEGRTLELTLPSYQMPASKNASGYYMADDMDAVDLFVGSDGTLGVITQIELELLPLPPVIWGVSCFFTSETQAIDFTVRVRRELAGVAALEFFDAPSIEILRRQKARSSAFSALPDVAGWVDCCVYAELHCGTEEEALALLWRLGGLLEECGGDERHTWVSRTRADRETQSFFRHAVPESVNMQIDERRKKNPSITKLAADMSVPDERLRDVMALYRRSLAENHLESATWGHIGNNHLHVNVLPRNMEDYTLGKRLFGEWAERITEMGGAVSAEHGVGKLKRDYLTVMYGEAHIREMARLKLQLDPHGIFGRGNLFAPERMEEVSE